MVSTNKYMSSDTLVSSCLCSFNIIFAVYNKADNLIDNMNEDIVMEDIYDEQSVKKRLLQHMYGRYITDDMGENITFEDIVHDSLRSLESVKYVLSQYDGAVDIMRRMTIPETKPEVLMYLLTEGILTDPRQVLANNMKNLEVVEYIFKNHDAARVMKSIPYAKTSTSVFTLLARLKLWTDSMSIISVDTITEDTARYIESLRPAFSAAAVGSLVRDAFDNNAKLIPEHIIIDMIISSETHGVTMYALLYKLVDLIKTLQAYADAGDLTSYYYTLRGVYDLKIDAPAIINIDALISREDYGTISRILDLQAMHPTILHYISPSVLASDERLFKKYVSVCPFIDDVRYCTALPLSLYHHLSFMLRGRTVLDYGLLVPVMSMYDIPTTDADTDTVKYLLANLTGDHLINFKSLMQLQ